MMLRQSDVDEICQLIVDREFGRLEAVQVESLSLSATLQLACFFTMSGFDLSGVQVQKFIEAQYQRFSSFKLACKLFKTVPAAFPVWQESFFAAPEFELFPVSHEALAANDWPLFLQRFSRTMRQNGFGASFALAFAAALGEMADNVDQHSNKRGLKRCQGLAGFHVSAGQAVFAVVDSGRGVLASLHENPRWQSLPDNASALEAVIQKQATRKIYNQHGDGFRQVFKSLVDHNGQVHLRSGDARALLEGTSLGRSCEFRFGPAIPGVAVTVSCAANDVPLEMPLPE